MPIRLMVWNIQQFGQNKLGTNVFDNVGLRRNYIQATIAAVNPDILAVIEVRTGQQAGVGSLVTDTSGGPGVRTLWGLLPGGTIATGGPWAVIPPLLINPNIGVNNDRAYSEGIAVFFRTDVLDFTGPYKWTGTAFNQGAQPITNPAAPNATGAAAQAYAAPWNTCLPAAQPASGLPALNQNRLAGQAIFWDNNNQQIFFPGLFNRNPWLTTFEENNAMVPRTIKLWTAHFPPHTAPARQAIAALADIPAVTAPLGANEVRVLCGDFNVNTLNAAEANIFDQLTANTQRIANHGTTNLYTSQFAAPTVVRGVKQANTAGAGPWYGYIQSRNGFREGLDNLLTAYGAAAGAPANPRVVNRVVGTPRQDIFPPPPAIYTVALGTDIPTINATGFANAAKWNLFRGLNNFGQIGGKIGASDHMALVIDL